jgi:hypothetical protein
LSSSSSASSESQWGAVATTRRGVLVGVVGGCESARGDARARRRCLGRPRRRRPTAARGRARRRALSRHRLLWLAARSLTHNHHHHQGTDTAPWAAATAISLGTESRGVATAPGDRYEAQPVRPPSHTPRRRAWVAAPRRRHDRHQEKRGTTYFSSAAAAAGRTWRWRAASRMSKQSKTV